MRIAVASRDGKSVSGHIGRCAEWIVYEVNTDAEPAEAAEVERVSLPKELVFHYYKDDQPHPLKSCSVIVGKSCGDSFGAKMQKRGIEVTLTAETDPPKAVVDYVSNTLLPAKPRHHWWPVVQDGGPVVTGTLRVDTVLPITLTPPCWGLPGKNHEETEA